jgi:cyanophycinase-like exopeptidase
MCKKEAIRIVESELNQKFNEPQLGRLVVVDELTRVRAYGWVFFVNTERFVATRDRKLSVVGNGPIAFVIADNSMHKLSSGVHPDEAIAQFESQLANRK